MSLLRISSYANKKIFAVGNNNIGLIRNIIINGPKCCSTIKVNYCLRTLATDAATVQKNTGGIRQFDDKDEADMIEKLRATFAKETNAGGVVPIFKKALLYANNIGIKDDIGEYSYGQLYNAAKKLSIQISNVCGKQTGNKVVFMCSNNVLWSLVCWACWISGQIAVPLNPQHPRALLDYFVDDCRASLLISVPEFEKTMSPLAQSINRPLIIVDHNFVPTTSGLSYLDPQSENVIKQADDTILIDGTPDSKFYSRSNAIIFYTSGSTGRPKGVLISHRNLEAQTAALSSAWRITSKDSILHVLPLSHIHGSVNALACPLSVGAKVLMLPKFNSANVWSVLLNVNMPTRDRINLFMGVPTHFARMIAEYDKTFSKNDRMVEYIRAQCEKNIRLMISGSAPLPTPIFDKWHTITGHKLLGRYGTTEIGMVLSNPYITDKIRTRSAYAVGQPLPGCEVKLVENGKTLIQMKGEFGKGYWSDDPLPIYSSSDIKTSPNPPVAVAANQTKSQKEQIAGEIFAKGPTVFSEYINKPDVTKSAFEDGWFKTGDYAKFENNQFHILGRTSVDMIKTGGYKVSALEIETKLLEHPSISDVCIVGLPDETWGQKVAAIIVQKSDVTDTIQEWCRDNLAPYQIPKIWKIIPAMPRNEIGKINKVSIKELFTAELPVKE